MKVDIVVLSEANADALSNIGPDVFDEEIQPAFLDAFLTDPGHVMYLALVKNVVVGMASAVEYFHPDKPPQLWINEVGVAESHRRQGIGRQLVEALIAEAERRGCAYAWLGTEATNISGKACFASVPKVEGPEKFLLYEWGLDD